MDEARHFEFGPHVDRVEYYGYRW